MPDTRQRLRVTIQGAVQGVGFRPFVFRLAGELGLAGWVINAAQGVVLEVEGARPAQEAFLARVRADAPPRALIQRVAHEWLSPAGFSAFEIRRSDGAGAKTALILPDLATCDDCLSEVLDPADRRFRYPFTNCTNCGPRFTIIESLPYDRPHTTMRAFPMCARCRAEYEDPLDRRFHAQPNACPACGPQLALWAAGGEVLSAGDFALRGAADALRAGQVLALKGLGGFQLLVDARNEAAVCALRARKRREEKPLALMAPGLDWVDVHCAPTPLERRLLASVEAPIVLVSRRSPGEAIAPSVAPGVPEWGVMLPYTPLHHLLLRELGFPVVATSGNRSDEPICTDERDALRRLTGIADVFLVHDRPIARRADDSVVRAIAGEGTFLRRARGYAPLPVPLPVAARQPLLAVGGHLKNTVALALGDNAFLSPHVGDLDTVETVDAFERAIADLQRLYEAPPAAAACDLHPDYRSTRYAEGLRLPLTRVQHHHAHVLACLAENGLDPAAPVLGVAWDGTGYGPDGTVWGGEFLRVEGNRFARVAHLRPFRLPGGERAVVEPRRAALGVLHELDGADAAAARAALPFAPHERALLAQALERRVNAPQTSSAGRLFDAAAALLGLHPRARYEGQAALALEGAAAGIAHEVAYPFDLVETEGPVVVDWAPAVRALLADRRRGAAVGWISLAFHHTLVEAIAALAARAGLPRVALTGGCFQNRILSEGAIARLRARGFEVAWHRRVPAGDGGLALGQLLAALLAGPRKE